MNFEYSSKTKPLMARLNAFMDQPSIRTKRSSWRRWLMADGLDEVPRNQIGKLELSRYIIAEAMKAYAHKGK